MGDRLEVRPREGRLLGPPVEAVHHPESFLLELHSNLRPARRLHSVVLFPPQVRDELHQRPAVQRHVV
eukprot:9487176-Pyramimonas_sp.AAC.1